MQIRSFKKLKIQILPKKQKRYYACNLLRNYVFSIPKLIVIFICQLTFMVEIFAVS